MNAQELRLAALQAALHDGIGGTYRAILKRSEGYLGFMESLGIKLEGQKKPELKAA